MKLNRFFMVALAGMTMFSCSDNDEIGGSASNGEKKTVVLKLDGIKSGGSRAADSNTDKTTPGQVMVHDVAVILYSDANKKIVKVDKISVTENTTAWNELIGSVGRHYANVDASVDRVLVLGNVTEKKEIDGLLVEKGDMSQVLNYKYLLKEENISKKTADTQEGTENTKNYVTLYDNKQLEESGTVSDNTYGDKDNKLFKANLEIKPLISRFEVTKIGCQFELADGGEQLYGTITLKGIGLVDYFTQATVDVNGNVTATDIMSGISEDAADEALVKGIYSPLSEQDLPGDSYKFCTTEAQQDWGWTFDIIEDDGIEIGNTNTDAVTYFQKDDNDLNFAYNFFPMDGGIYNTPNVRLYIDATNVGDNTESPKHFVVTTSMTKDGAPLVPERGKIYQFAYEFREKNIGKWEEKISVEVIVTVADWVVEEVTPGF